jgi:hypothetical protein
MLDPERRGWKQPERSANQFEREKDDRRRAEKKEENIDFYGQ